MQGKCIHITCSRQNTILELKQIIKQKENIDPEGYNLVFNGRFLGPSFYQKNLQDFCPFCI